jgi:hypothetical protein
MSYFKPPRLFKPCLGPGKIQRTGRPVSECSFIEYEDFCKLVVFDSKWVPSIVEDLVDQLTLGLISCKMVEEYLGPMRSPDNVEGYPTPQPI